MNFVALAACAALTASLPPALTLPTVPKDLPTPMGVPVTAGTPCGLRITHPSAVIVGSSFFDPPPVHIAQQMPARL